MRLEPRRYCGRAVVVIILQRGANLRASRPLTFPSAITMSEAMDVSDNPAPLITVRCLQGWKGSVSVAASGVLSPTFCMRFTLPPASTTAMCSL